jgi:hypothetical protein
VRYDDYKVTNPAAVQFDPAQRLSELAALGTVGGQRLGLTMHERFSVPPI